VSAYCLFTQIDLPKDFKEGFKSKAKFVDPEIYARPNNELYACGEGDHLVPLPESTADVQVDDSRCQDIIDYCSSFSDEMRDGEVLVRQACYLPLVETGGGPLVGPTNKKGVWIATGHTCWGIQNGPGTGKLMSEFIFEGKASSANVDSLDPRNFLK
jgi:glycine/D-amino acid oxidase-like deaminating enzyme